MKRLYFILALHLAITSIGQSIYFNKRYDNFNSCDYAIGVDTFNLQYFSYGIACTSITFNALNLNSYDFLNGNKTNSKTYQRSGVNYLPQTGKGIRVNKQHYLVCGAYLYKTDTSLAFLWRFSKNLDSVTFKTYGYLNQLNLLNGMILGKDNKIYMVGGVNNSSYSNEDILLIKTDTSGNEIWKKKIGLSTWSESGFSISPCQNGDLLISGVRYVPNYTSANQGPLITRIDTAGNVKWQKFFPSFAYSNGSFDIKELPNGDIVFINSTAKVVGSKHLRRFKFTKLDSLGNVIWDKVRGLESEASDAYKFIQEPSGNYILAALSSYTTNNNTVSGWAYKLDVNGDSITSREYKIGAMSQNYFRDVVRCPDNGYLFGGFVIPIPGNGDIGTQDIWLLKTDSLLCEYQSCPNALLSVNGFENDFDKSISAYPNPTNDKISISFNTESGSVNTIRLCDILGKELFSEKTESKSLVVNLNKFNSGIYFLEIKSGSNLATKKIIKH